MVVRYRNDQKAKMKKGVIVLIIAFIALITFTFISTLQEKISREEGPEDIAIKEMQASVLRNGIIDEIIHEESITEGAKTFLVFTGTRNSLIGMSEYTETVKIWVDKVDGVVTKTEVIAQEEEKCQSDSDCISGGPNGGLCTLQNVLPKLLKSSSQPDESFECHNLTSQPDESFKCYNLTNCRCINEHCRWESNEEFDECMKRIDIISLPVPYS
jgi:hypothetical protein